MKYFIDGDQLVITRDDFVDLQESSAVFINVTCNLAKKILEARGFATLSSDSLNYLQTQLE